MTGCFKIGSLHLPGWTEKNYATNEDLNIQYHSCENLKSCICYRLQIPVPAMIKTWHLSNTC